MVAAVQELLIVKQTSYLASIGALCQQKSIGLKFSKSQTGNDVR